MSPARNAADAERRTGARRLVAACRLVAAKTAPGHAGVHGDRAAQRLDRSIEVSSALHQLRQRDHQPHSEQAQEHAQPDVLDQQYL